LLSGINVIGGRLTHQVVADSFQLPCTPAENLL
jgi:hypothetical protein